MQEPRLGPAARRDHSGPRGRCRPGTPREERGGCRSRGRSPGPAHAAAPSRCEPVNKVQPWAGAKRRAGRGDEPGHPWAHGAGGEGTGGAGLRGAPLLTFKF